MVGHGEVHHACGALLLGQLQTGAVPVLEHAGLGVLVCGGLELCTRRHSLQVGNSAAVLQSDLCIGNMELIGLGFGFSRSNELRHQIHIMVGHGEVQHACGALLLGQLQTSPALEHLGLGVLVCDSLEFCTHRHSLQIGNIAAILQENLCAQYIELMGLGFGIGIRRRDLVINRGDLHIVCGHREGDGLAVDIHRISGQTLLDLPVAEGHALRLPCNESDFLTKCTLFWLPVHSQGIGVLLVLCFQRDIVCGHREADVCLGGIRTLRHALCLPITEGVAFFIGCDKVDVIACNVLFVHAVHGQGVGVLLVLRGQRDVVCGHLEGDGRLGGVHISGQTFLLPTSEGVAVLLGCGSNELCTHRYSCQVGNIAAVLQGDLCIGDLELIGLGSVLGVLCLQRDVICGHREGDSRLGGVHVSGQTGHFPTGEGVTVLLVCGEAEFLSCNVLGRLVIHGQGVLFGHNIGAYPIDYVIIIGAGVFNIVLTRRHLDVHIVAAGGGGNSFALVGAVQQGHLRVGIVIICAIVFHRVLGGIVGKVLSLGRVAERLLTQLNRTGLVLSAFLCSDGYLIAAIRIGYLVGKVVGKDLTLIYTGNALKLSRKLANAVCLRADHRIGAVLVLDAVKVIQRKALKGQLFGYGVVIRQQVISA